MRPRFAVRRCSLALALACCTLACCALPACSRSRERSPAHERSRADAGARDAAVTRDAAADAGARLHIGDPCRPEQGWRPDAGTGADASSRNAFPPIGVGTCGSWRDAPDGYFTARCEINGDCPDQARCGLGTHWCVARCRSNADCRPPASCHLSAAAAVSYCQVTGGVLGRGDRDAGAGDDCELPCGLYQTCCAAQCYDLANDPQHCGRCDHACGDDAPYCEDGRCLASRCAPECGAGEQCCAIYDAQGATPTCVALHERQPCPSGCHDCAR